MIRATIFVAAAAVAPSLAVAAGNNLILVNPIYDTTGQKFGSASLSGGFGTTPPGACYNTPLLVGPFPQFGGVGVPLISFEKEVWVKAPTVLPSTPQLIFGDESAYIAESQTGYPVFGTGAVFTSGITYQSGTVGGTPVYTSEAINDGKWHLLTLSVSSGDGSPYAVGVAFLDGNPIKNSHYNTNGSPFSKPLNLPAPFANDPYGVTSIVTGIAGGSLHGYDGLTLGNFAGEVDSVSCSVPSQHAGDYTYPFPELTGAFGGSETGLLGLWQLDGNGNDSATYLLPTGQAYAPPPASSFVSPGPPPLPPVTPPAGGFPLQP